MKVSDLVSEWQTGDRKPEHGPDYDVRLSEQDAARIAALRDMFPAANEQRILADLVAAALNELCDSFAHEPGDEIAGYDENGEPMYMDAGLRPRFQQLARQHAQRAHVNQNS